MTKEEAQEIAAIILNQEYSYDQLVEAIANAILSAGPKWPELSVEEIKKEYRSKIDFSVDYYGGLERASWFESGARWAIEQMKNKEGEKK